MALTVANALSAVYRLEAAEQARINQINKSIDSLEAYAKSVTDEDIEKFKKYGIDIYPIVAINFDELRGNLEMQKQYFDAVNSIIDKTVSFVEEYMNDARS